MSPPSGNLEDLIRKVRHGSPRDREEAAGEIFKIYQARVLSHFSKKGVPRDEAEDLTQDVFSRVFKSMDTFHGESEAELNAWLFQIVRNRFANYIRDRKTQKRGGVEEPIEDSGEIPDPEERPLDALVRRQRRERLRRALPSLPEQMRKCCILRYVDGLKYKEIADELGISIETVKAHLFQGRRRLTQAVQGPEGHGAKP